MLEDILRTRVMVKSSMKRVKEAAPFDMGRYQTLFSQQMSLKMVANCTYGYTSASFSGRMPCCDIADAIVDTARATLERAIKIIETHRFDGHEAPLSVIYGDTDSCFVHAPGRTLREAFSLGREIARVVTANNPAPVELCFEKVLMPSVYMAKKRYVGYSFEKEGDIPAPREGCAPPAHTAPSLLCKGAELVRRDVCGLARKLFEETVRLCFDASLRATLESVPLSVPELQQSFFSLLERRVSLIFRGGVNVLDYVLAKEVRMGTYSPGGTLPASARVAAKRAARDPGYVVHHGERVQYLVVNGPKVSRLCDLVVSPDEFYRDKTLSINVEYYIVKQVLPAIARFVYPALRFGLPAYRAGPPSSSTVLCRRLWLVQCVLCALRPRPVRSLFAWGLRLRQPQQHRPPRVDRVLLFVVCPKAALVGTHLYVTLTSNRENCINCGSYIPRGSGSSLCPTCLSKDYASGASARLVFVGARKERKRFALSRICRQCYSSVCAHLAASDMEDWCSSTECPVWYDKR